MIAQHRNRSVAKIAYKTQYLQRIWTAIYEVTREPETVLFFSEPDFVEEASQFRVTTLDVTDRVDGHRKLSAVRRGLPV